MTAVPPLRLPFACIDPPGHHAGLTRSQLDGVALDDQPRFAGHDQEQLIETRLMHPDLTAGVEVNHVRVGLTGTGPEVNRRGTDRSEIANRVSNIRRESDHLIHLRSIAPRGRPHVTACRTRRSRGTPEGVFGLRAHLELGLV